MAYLKSVHPNFLLNIFCLQKVPLKLHKLYLVFILHALFCQLTLNELHSLEFMPIRLGLHTSTYSLCLSTQSTSIFMVPRSDFALIHFWAPQVEGIKDARREVLTSQRASNSFWERIIFSWIFVFTKYLCTFNVFKLALWNYKGLKVLAMFTPNLKNWSDQVLRFIACSFWNAF